MKDLVINTAFCDMRSTREETLKKYASVTVNAAEVLVTPVYKPCWRIIMCVSMRPM